MSNVRFVASISTRWIAFRTWTWSLHCQAISSKQHNTRSITNRPWGSAPLCLSQRFETVLPLGTANSNRIVKGILPTQLQFFGQLFRESRTLRWKNFSRKTRTSRRQLRLVPLTSIWKLLHTGRTRTEETLLDTYGHRNIWENGLTEQLYSCLTRQDRFQTREQERKRNKFQRTRLLSSSIK